MVSVVLHFSPDVRRDLFVSLLVIELVLLIVGSVKIPAGKERSYLTKDTVSRKNCVITVKNDDTICLARAIVTAYANLKPERWSNTQLRNGFNSSRKLQRDQATKLHEEAQVEINDYGNDLSDIETFAKHIRIEINIMMLNSSIALSTQQTKVLKIKSIY